MPLYARGACIELVALCAEEAIHRADVTGYLVKTLFRNFNNKARQKICTLAGRFEGCRRVLEVPLSGSY